MSVRSLARGPRDDRQLRRDWSSIILHCEIGCLAAIPTTKTFPGKSAMRPAHMLHSFHSLSCCSGDDDTNLAEMQKSVALSRWHRASDRQRQVSPMPETPRRDGHARGSTTFPVIPVRGGRSCSARQLTVSDQIGRSPHQPQAARDCETAALAGPQEEPPRRGRKRNPGETRRNQPQRSRARAREGGGPR